MAAFHLIIYGRFWVITEGGTYQFGPQLVKAGRRFTLVPGDRDTCLGFRPVRSCPISLLYSQIER